MSSSCFGVTGFCLLLGLLSGGSRVWAEEIPPRIVHQPSDVVVKVGQTATLFCRAEGSPKPTVEWLRNGQPLETAKAEGQLQPMVLSEGSLFFWNAGGGRHGPSHEGVYTCVARNSVGVVISQNASIHLAVLRDEFDVQPSDVVVAEGEVAVFNCVPPKGHPEPDVIWKKDGVPINNTDHHFTELSGKLVIAPTEKNQSGSYICVARNVVGVRESRAARLSVLAKPVLVLKPENVSVRKGDSAHFHCKATGDPPPVVFWSRERGTLPYGRYVVNSDQSLQLHYVMVEDTGRYICNAVSEAGVAMASAQLQVEEAGVNKHKDFHKELSALRVSLENVSIVAVGSNMSLVQWKLQTLQTQPHHLDGFEVLYRSLLPINSDWAAKKVALPSFQAEIGPLKRGYKYAFKVRPYGSSLYGRESNTLQQLVPEKVPSAPPLAVSIRVNHEKNDSMHLSWEPPPHDAHNGILQGYQVWCVDSDDQQNNNWTIGSNQHNLEISNLKPMTQYWITIAAVNGAGVGVASDPRGFIINPQLRILPDADSHAQNLSSALDQLQNPAVIGSFGAMLWCVLVVAAIFLLKRCSNIGSLVPKPNRAKGLSRLKGEDFIIKHRMATPESPWISDSWNVSFNKRQQDLWAQSQNPHVSSTSLPFSSQKDSSVHGFSIPVGPDSCSVYGTFYVDPMSSGMKTFSRPGHCSVIPHGLPHQEGTETIRIFTPPVSKSPTCRSCEALPWKQAIRPQPKMGILRESLGKRDCGKRELHAVSSVPVPFSLAKTNSPAAFKQRFSHMPAGCHGGCPDCGDAAVSSRSLHYSASLHLVDNSPPPTNPTEDSTDRNMFSSDGSQSTKLTEDTSSFHSVPPSSGHYGQLGSYSLSPASCFMLLDNEQDDTDHTLTSQEATHYLELSSTPDRSSLCDPIRSAELEDDSAEPRTVMLRHPCLQSSPTSCCSDWEGSLWNTWSSVMDNRLDSTRTSLISSVDSCYTSDSATFARLLAVAAHTITGVSLNDLSLPASPLSTLDPSFCAGHGAFGDLEPIPAWDWSRLWMEEMDAQYKVSYPARNTQSLDT